MTVHFWGSNGFGPEKTNPFRVLDNETKKIIVIKLYKKPMTVTQLADDLGLSQPAVFEHIRTLLETGLVKETDIPQEQRKYKIEKYYIPAFPMISKKDRELMMSVCRKINKKTAKIYKLHRNGTLGNTEKDQSRRRRLHFERSLGMDKGPYSHTTSV